MNKEEHTVYAMRFASQQMLIDKLERENNNLKKMVIHKHKYASEMEGKYILKKYKLDELRSWLEKEIIDSKAGSSQYYWFGRVLSKLNELKDSDVDERRRNKII